MKTGAYISGLGHLGVLVWAVIGGAAPDLPDAANIEVTDVSVISTAEFSALLSRAPDAETSMTTPVPPPAAVENPGSPGPDDTPRRPDLTSPRPPQPPEPRPGEIAANPPAVADFQVASPDMAQPSGADERGVTLIAPSDPVSDRDNPGSLNPDRLAIASPRQPEAPRVDTTPAPAPPTDAETSEDTQKATIPDPTATDPARVTAETAPDQAATEIVTEANEAASIRAPARSSRPKGRPADLGDKPSTADEIRKALERATAEGAQESTGVKIPQAAPSGPPLDNREKDGLRLAVQKCWNVGSLSTDALRLTVTVGVSLSKDGKPVSGSIHLISSSDGSNAAEKQAFEAAKRAIIRCGGKGFDLPPEKYDHWREIEMTFNPEKMRIK